MATGVVMSLPSTLSSLTSISWPALTSSSPACAASIFWVIVIGIILFLLFQTVVDGAHERLDAGADDVSVGSGAPCVVAVFPGDADVAGGAGVRALIERVLVVALKRKGNAKSFFQGVAYGVQTSVSDGDEFDFAAADERGHGRFGHAALLEVRFTHVYRMVFVDVRLFKDFEHFLGTEFLVGVVADAFDGIAEMFAHFWRQRVAVRRFEDVADATFSGLGIDADNVAVVRSGHVVRIERNVWHAPFEQLFVFPPFHAFGDGVLMGAGEGGEHELAGVWLSWRDVHPGQALVAFDDGWHVREVEFWIDAVGVHVHRQRDRVDVAGALSVAKQAAFDALGAGEQGELGVGDTGSPIVVRMRGEDDGVPVF